MTTQKELDLLVDLTKLLKKHGPDTFKSLATTISSPEMTQQLSSILVQVAKTSRKTEQKRRPSIPRSLTALESTEPEKYQLLINFYNDLVAKKNLTSLRDIQDFATNNGLAEIRTKSRQKAISPLFSSLIKLPNKQLIVIIQSLKSYDIDDRSLEGWSNIILKKNQKLDEGSE